MITVSHFLLYGKDRKADRTLFRHELGFGSIDVGDAWRIFAMPSAEAEIHVRDGSFPSSMRGTNRCAPRRFHRRSGGHTGLHQPLPATALNLN